MPDQSSKFRGSVPRICETCGAGFSVPPSYARRGVGRYCSRQCYLDRSGPPEDQFWSKVDKSGECWIWTGRRGPRGYGRFRIGSKAPGAHRVAYELTYGPIPDELIVCHHCDNPPCVRPDHLFLGTHLDNAADRDSKGRTARGDRSGARLYPERRPRGDLHNSRLRPETIIRGERQGRAKLTDALVREIRMRAAAGETARSITDDLKVCSKSTIERVINRVRWSHVD